MFNSFDDIVENITNCRTADLQPKLRKITYVTIYIIYTSHSVDSIIYGTGIGLYRAAF